MGHYKYAFVSSVGRGDELAESSQVHKIDLETGEEIAKTYLPNFYNKKSVIPSSERGGPRGARGVLIYRGFLWVAGFNCLHQVYLDLNLMKTYWFSNANDIHKIYLAKNGTYFILTTCYDDSLKKFYPEEGFVFNLANFHHLREYSKSKNPHWDDYLHVNSLGSKCEDFVLLNNPGIIYDRRSKKILLEDHDYLGGSHDLLWIGQDYWVTLASPRKTVLLLRFVGDKFVIHREAYTCPYIGGTKENMVGWMRGAFYDEGVKTLWIGIAPGSILKLVLNNEFEVESSRRFQFTECPSNSPFDVVLSK